MPSNSLQGLTTPTGWTITTKLTQKLGSGGNFCTRYLATGPNDQVGFLKAMDLTRALQSLEHLNQLTSEYLFEQHILGFCKDKNMSKVVVPIDAGQMQHPNFEPPLNNVFYIIFEKAEGDLRQTHLEVQDKSWSALFKTLHHVCIGVEQLHRAGIAHQDIKPSNILRFSDTQNKISDLGRVTDVHGKSPFSLLDFTGDRSYMPIEYSHGFKLSEFRDRFLSDMYLVGSLAYQGITGAQISTAIFSEAELFFPNIRSLNYAEALPYYQSAFVTILNRFETECRQHFGEKLAQQLTSIVSEMCNPNYEERGAPKFSSKTLRYSMRRYTGKFANIVSTAKIAGIA